MTVAELVEHLKTLPQGHLVVFRSHSDMNALEAKDIEVTRGVRHHNLRDTVRDYNKYEWEPGTTVWACRNPTCPQGLWWANYQRKCPYCSKELVEQPKEPEFVDVVMFPGN